MNILITGATGFIGQRLVLHLAGQHNVISYKADILAIQKDDIARHNIDAAIHLVGLNDALCRENPKRGYEVNVIGTHNLLRALSDRCKVIYFSTIHVYGNEGVLTEETPVFPQSIYSMSHYLAEEFVRERGGVVLRFSNGFGCPVKREIQTAWSVVVNSMCKQAVTTGEIVLNIGYDEVRNFITVTDMCRAVSHFIYNNYSGVFNVGGSESIPIIEMGYRISNRYNKLFGCLPPIKILDGGTKQITDLDYRIDKLKNTGFDLLENFDEEIDNTLRMVSNATKKG
jgi:UDP-glucose 4-epimerase